MSRQSSRDKIVGAARRLFYTHGFDDTSLGDIAREAGVPKGNFYYHFPSKDDVLRAVLEARRLDTEGALACWADDHPDPRSRLRRFVAMITSQRDEIVRYGCPTGSLLTELGKKRDDLRPNALSILNLYVELAVAAFAELGHDEARARTLGIRLLARAQGAIVVAHAYADTEVLERELAEIATWIDEQDRREPTGARRPVATSLAFG